MFYAWTRRWLFSLDPETSHGVALQALHAAGPLLRQHIPADPRTVMGIQFPNPVGLAAGLDKNAEHVDALAQLGFGFIEVGTVTPKAQPGNTRPRLFRLAAAEAIINRMGFNNHGVAALVERVQQRRYRGVLGINIGKNATTPLERAVDDYLLGLQAVYPHAHYVTVNISSPNTPGLRDLQYGAALDTLLATLKQAQGELAEQHGRYVPLVLKVAPDLNDADIPVVAESLRRHGMDGLIATNTTFSRQGVEGLPHATETGGLSGAPLTTRATEVVRLFHTALNGQLPIIAAGGIMSAADAQAKLAAGASLVQIYTGLIYRGPRLIRDIAAALKEGT